MANEQRKGGIIFFKVDGSLFQAKGNFTYNLGLPKREAIVGADGVHGYKDAPQVAFIEGEITDSKSLDMATFMKIENSTVTLELANGKVICLRDAWNASEGTGNTEEGNMPVRFEGKSADEIS